MTFDDIHPAVFGIFSNWIYSQKILNHDNEVPHLLSLGRLWVLADRFLIPSLQNGVIDAISHQLDIRKTTGLHSLINLAYQHTEGDNELARFVAWKVAVGNPLTLELCKTPDTPKEFFFGIMMVLKKECETHPSWKNKAVKTTELKKFYV